MLQQKEISKGVYAAFKDSPFALPSAIAEVYVAAGSSIQEIIDKSVKEEWQKKYLRVILNDEVVQPEDYPLTYVKESDVVGMVLVPQTGEVGQIFKAIAVIAIVIVATYFAGPAGLGFSAPLAAGIGAAAGLAASLTLNALFPPPVPGVQQSATAGTSEDPVYGFSRTGNQINRYAAIPRIYGTRKVFPQHAIAPYIIAKGTDQYLYQAFTAGYGPLKIEDIRIGDNPIANYKDVEYFVHEGFVAGNELQIVKHDNWQDPYSIKLSAGVPNTITTTDDAEEASLAIQFSQGLFQLSSQTGERQTTSVVIDVQARQVGSSTWNPITAYDATVDDASLNSSVTSNTWNASGSVYSETPHYAVVSELPASSTVPNGEYRTIATESTDEYGNTSVSYQDYQNSYVVASSTSEIKVEKASSRPFFVNVNLKFPSAGRYEIKVQRVTANRENETTNPHYDICNISGLRSIKSFAPVATDKPVSLIELKIRATDQLNGAVNNLSCIVTSKLPVWSGSSWSVAETRNPAWAYLDVMRGSAAKMPIADSRIDLASFKAWADWCDAIPENCVATQESRACCDIEITSQTTAWEALKLIAAAGYATPSQNSGKYSIAVDKPQSAPVQVFSPKNIRSFSGNLTYHIQPHALRISYTQAKDTEADEIIVYDDGYNADGSGGKQQATIFETMKLVGVCRYQQAYTVGRRALAQGKLRIEKFTISCDVENLLATRGSLVLLAHDVPKIGSGTGKVVSVSGNTITIDEDFKLTTGTVYANIRHATGSQSSYTLSNISGSTATISGSSVQEGDLIVYGELNRVNMPCLVKSVRPGQDLTATLELVPYAPAIYTAETDAIPERDPWGGDWTGGNTGGGTNTGNKTTPGQVTSLLAASHVNYNNKTPLITVNLSWGLPATGGKATKYKVYYFQTNGWKLLGTTAERTYTAFDDYTFVDSTGAPIDMAGKSLVFAVSAVGTDESSLPAESAAHVSVTPIPSTTNSAATLTAVGGVFEIILSWTYGNSGFDAAYAELWGGTVNNRANATMIAKVAVPAKTYHHVGLTPGSTWYYWIRFVNGKGEFSAWYPASATGGVSASPSTDPTVILTQLNNAVDTTQLATELNRRINLIDDPDTVPGSVSAKIKTETTNRTNADSALQSQITTISATTTTNAAAIQTEATARANGDAANASLINQVQARLDTGDYAAVKIESSANASAITGLNAKYSVQVDANGGVAGIMLNSSGVGTSSFIVSADAFKVYKPGYTAMPVFQVGSVNGVNAVGVSGNLIVDGTIVTRGIAGQAVSQSMFSQVSAQDQVFWFNVSGNAGDVYDAYITGEWVQGWSGTSYLVIDGATVRLESPRDGTLGIMSYKTTLATGSHYVRLFSSNPSNNGSNAIYVLVTKR